MGPPPHGASISPPRPLRAEAPGAAQTYQGEAGCCHVGHDLPGDVGGGVAPAAEVEAQAPVRGHEGEPCKPEGGCWQGWPSLVPPCSQHPGKATPAKPPRQHSWLSHTNDIQVLPHHTLGVGAQEDVEVQDAPSRAPGQGRAGLQEHV